MLLLVAALVACAFLIKHYYPAQWAKIAGFHRAQEQRKGMTYKGDGVRTTHAKLAGPSMAEVSRAEKPSGVASGSSAEAWMAKERCYRFSPDIQQLSYVIPHSDFDFRKLGILFQQNWKSIRRDNPTVSINGSQRKRFGSRLYRGEDVHINMENLAVQGYISKGEWLSDIAKKERLSEYWIADWNCVLKEDGKFIPRGQALILIRPPSRIQGPRPQRMAGLGRAIPAGSEDSGTLVWVRKSKELWGLQTPKGAILTKGVYSSYSSFDEGIAAVKRDAYWGAINVQGQEVIPCQYDKLDRLEAGSDVRFLAKKGNDWGIVAVDVNGQKMQELIPPQFQEIDVDSSASWFYNIRKENKWGLISSDGKMMVEPLYDRNMQYDDQIDLGMACLNGKCGFVNRNGNMVIKDVFEDVQAFSNDVAAVKLGGLWGYIDLNGKMLTPFLYDKAGDFGIAEGADTESGEVMSADVVKNGKGMHLTLSYTPVIGEPRVAQ